MLRDAIVLPSPTPGTQRHLAVHRFGRRRDGKKVYLQSGLHADEWPGMLVLQHLMVRLEAAERAGKLKGEILCVPFANPIGLAQHVAGYLVGRFDLNGTGNFNRNFGDLVTPVRERVESRLGTDAQANVRLIREALREAVAALPAQAEAEHLKRTLLGLSIDADLVLDLHCDDDSLAHLYGTKIQQDWSRDIAASLGIEYVMVEDLGGVIAFDGTHLQVWHELAKAFPKRPIPVACQAATVEYRGQYDVRDDWAAADAERLYNYLIRFGVIADDPIELPKTEVRVSPLEAIDLVKASCTGLVTYRVPLGHYLQAGEEFGDIVLLDHPEPNQRIPLVSQTEGYLFTRTHRRLVRPGDLIAKVFGATPLPDRTLGNLLQL